MTSEFVVVIKEHRLFGWILLPCRIIQENGRSFYKVVEWVVADNIKSNANNYLQQEKDIVNLADEYTETALSKSFGGRRVASAHDFVATLKLDYIENYIRPYIEKRILKIIEICKANYIKLFFKNDTGNIFPEDEVVITKYNATAIFNFIKDEQETKYFLTIRYKNKDINLLKKAIYVLSNDPCVIVLDNKLMFFDDIDAKKLMPFTLKNYVSIAKRVEPTYYSKFVLNTIKSDYCVNAKGFSIQEEYCLPKPILVVEPDLTGELAFTLNFCYKDIRFLFDSPNLVVVDMKSENGTYFFNKLVRDIQYESEVENAAYQIFESRIKPGVYKVKPQNGDKAMQHVFAINFLNFNKDKFVQAGIAIEQNIIKKAYYTGNISIDFNIQKKNDWFDVYAIVKLDDIEIPFIALKYYIINNIREFALPDGRVVVLPDEWFEKYKDIFYLGSVNKDTNTITLYDYQYALLSNLPLDILLAQRINELEDDLMNIGKLPSLKPENICANLRPYQITAYNWLTMMKKHNFGAILADDMGLGKTLCTLSVLANSVMMSSDKFEEGLFSFPKKVPSLLIVPKSLIYNWKAEAKKFAPQLKILEYIGNNRTDYIKSFPLYDIIITGYGTIRNDIDLLSKTNFNYIILDESQLIKNSQSKTYIGLMKLSCNHRLALTGTPLENSLTDLWSQINFVNPGLLGNLSFFKKRFVNSIEKNGNEEAINKLRHIIYPFILRRTKQQVLNDLPDLQEQVMLCEMSQEQFQIYEKEKSRTRNSIIDIMDKGVFEKSTVMVLQSLTKLRQIACHPSLIDTEFKGRSGKTDQIMALLQDLIPQHKVLIFSSFVKHLELIANELKHNDIDYAMLTGSTENRQDEVAKFSQNADVSVFLISIKAGGTGLNLTQADYVFIIDPWWNPAVEDQAVARAHRIGQKQSVMVYRFISENTIEQKIRIFQQTKADLASTFVNETTQFSAKLGQEVLKMLE